MRLYCLAVLMALPVSLSGQPSQADRYYAHEAVEDQHGVIAPWYQGQNGQCDLRVRIAAETLKRYPWTEETGSVVPGPHFVFNGQWRIDATGAISVPTGVADWNNGDLGQRAAYVLAGLIDYYRYSGDAAAVALLWPVADFLVDHCQTADDHPWPRFLISCPTKGTHYRDADPHGFIQLDIVAEAGTELLRAYQVTGNQRWFDAAAHWADVLAEKRNRDPGQPPWGRYANPEDVPWGKQADGNRMTGGVTFIMAFFDTLIDLGYTGRDDAITRAREAGRDYMRDHLLPAWTADETWGRNYWDWADPVQAENVTEWVVHQLLDHPGEFPNWRTDARNVLSLFLNRTSVSPRSMSNVYSGAWAYPESSGCCGRSLWYGPMELAGAYARYGAMADSEWAREMARRQILLATYDVHETGVVEDNIDGGQIVAGAWFKIAHPMALKHVLQCMAWLPEVLGAGRENHLMRTTAVVTDVVYGKGRIAYSTFDAQTPCVDVLRLAFRPAGVSAGGSPLREREDLAGNGYQVKPLEGGDYIVTVRHDDLRDIVVQGDDPQREIESAAMELDGDWSLRHEAEHAGGTVHMASVSGSTATLTFRGNQVRLLGSVGPDGGKADVFLDGEKQLVGIDCWCPQERSRQLLYARNGLAEGTHTLWAVVRGAGNALSHGSAVRVGAAQWSDAEGNGGFGEGGGPTGIQRVVFGRPHRTDAADADGNAWRPATEFIVRLGHVADAVAGAWWSEPRAEAIAGTPDPELYRYGVHARDATACFTVGPGTYYARLKFAETRTDELKQRVVSVAVNGKSVVDGMDVLATAGGLNRAVDLVINHIEPKHGIIEVRFRNRHGGEAAIQAIEIGPGNGGQGAEPVCVDLPWEPVLINGGFEEGVTGAVGSGGARAGGSGWTYHFLGAQRSYVWGETGFDIHPNCGLPSPRTGKEALRTHTDGKGHNVICQRTDVEPGRSYVASVWVKARNLRGKGFGHTDGDSAGLIIEEYADEGTLLIRHPKVAVTEATDYVQLSCPFVAGRETRSVRFILDAAIGCKYDEGSVTYDDCSLKLVSAP